MMLVSRRLAVVALALLAGAGCATKSDVQELERSVVDQLRQLEDQQDRLADRIGLAFDSLSEQERRQLTGRGELARRFDELADLMAQVLGLVAQNHQLLSEGRAAGTDVRPGVGGGGPGGGAPAGGAAPADEPTTFYNAALSQYNRGAYGTARSGFEDFLANYPEHELAPDAQYFLAETYAAEEAYGRALEEFSEVWERWSDHPRAASALYRSGVMEVERGRLDDGRAFFERVLAGYPNSAEAPLAEDQLARLR